MRKSNIKTPILFRVGVAMLCAVLFSSYMMSGLYARYSSNVTGSATAQVAKISYKITPDVTNKELSPSSHPLDSNDIPENCNIVAIEEEFTIENDGDVAYDYALVLTLTDKSTGEALPEYTLTSISGTAFLLTGETKTFEAGKFYYYIGDKLYSEASPTLSGTLGIGQTMKYKIIYFIDLQSTGETELFNKYQVLNYSITCTQID